MASLLYLLWRSRTKVGLDVAYILPVAHSVMDLVGGFPLMPILYPLVWFLRVVGAVIAGIAIIALLDKLGWYEARDLVNYVQNFLDTEILKVVLAPFLWLADWLGSDWFQIDASERLMVLVVWTVIATPALKNVDMAIDEPIPVRLPFIFKLPLMLLTAAVWVSMMAIVSLLLPGWLSRLLLAGFMFFILSTILSVSLHITFGKPPETEKDYYEYLGARERVKVAWTTYAEILVAMITLTFLDQYYG